MMNEINNTEIGTEEVVVEKEKVSLKDEFIPPPFPFNPPPIVYDYYIVDEKDRTVFNRYDTLDAAREETKRLMLQKKDIAPIILEFDGQVIKDSEKMNIKYLDKILAHRKGPDMALIDALADMLRFQKTRTS